MGWEVGIGGRAGRQGFDWHAQLIHASFSQMKQENCNTRIRDRKKAFERNSPCRALVKYASQIRIAQPRGVLSTVSLYGNGRKNGQSLLVQLRHAAVFEHPLLPSSMRHSFILDRDSSK